MRYCAERIAPLDTELMNDLDGIKVIYGRIAEDVRLAEMKERQCLLAKQLRCEGVCDSVPREREKEMIFPPIGGRLVCQRKKSERFSISEPTDTKMPVAQALPATRPFFMLAQ